MAKSTRAGIGLGLGLLVMASIMAGASAQGQGALGGLLPAPPPGYIDHFVYTTKQAWVDPSEGDCVLDLAPPSARAAGAVPYLSPTEAVNHAACNTMWGIRTRDGQQMSYHQLLETYRQAGQQWCQMDALFCLKTSSNFAEMAKVGSSGARVMGKVHACVRACAIPLLNLISHRLSSPLLSSPQAYSMMMKPEADTTVCDYWVHFPSLSYFDRHSASKILLTEATFQAIKNTMALPIDRSFIEHPGTDKQKIS